MVDRFRSLPVTRMSVISAQVVGQIIEQILGMVIIVSIGEWDPLSALVASIRHVTQGTQSHGSWQLEHPVVAMVGWCVLILAVCIPLALRRFRTTTAA